jgi:hypothetical protein
MTQARLRARTEVDHASEEETRAESGCTIMKRLAHQHAHVFPYPYAVMCSCSVLRNEERSGSPDRSGPSSVLLSPHAPETSSLTATMLRSVLRGASRRLPVPYSRSFARSAPARLDEARAAHVPGGTTTKLTFMNSVLPDGQKVPAYSVLDGSGNVLEGAELPEVCRALVHTRGHG